MVRSSGREIDTSSARRGLSTSRSGSSPSARSTRTGGSAPAPPLIGPPPSQAVLPHLPRQCVPVYPEDLRGRADLSARVSQHPRDVPRLDFRQGQERPLGPVWQRPFLTS